MSSSNNQQEAKPSQRPPLLEETSSDTNNSNSLPKNALKHLIPSLVVAVVAISLAWYLSRSATKTGPFQDLQHQQQRTIAIETKLSASAERETKHNLHHHPEKFPKIASPINPTLLPTTFNAPAAYFHVPSRSQPPKAILFFFHGCKHSGIDFFLLPQDRAVAQAVLDRNIAIVSFSASHPSGCWVDSDIPLVREQAQAFSKQTGYYIPTFTTGGPAQSNGQESHLPILGMGMSMGVSMLFKVYEEYQFASMACYTTYHWLGSEKDVTAIPPSIWIHMPRDKGTHKNMAHNIHLLQEQQYEQESTTNTHGDIVIDPEPFTLSRCQRFLPELGTLGCQALLHQLVDNGFVSEHDGTLARRPDRQFIAPLLYDIGLDNLTRFQELYDQDKTNDYLDMHIDHQRECADRDGANEVTASSPAEFAWPCKNFAGRTWPWAGVEQELAACYAKHDMVADHADRVLDFFMEHGKIDGPN